jgi:hypothetical protein
MRQILSKPRHPLSSWMIIPVACALLVIGAKLWMIACYGNPTPFWDQWDGEAASLYVPFFNGTLHLSSLIAAHNEHRILITRLWSLLLLELNGYWDPILQMVADTLILGAVVVLFIALFRPVLTRASWLVFALFSTAIFALPFGWENTLAGFNSQWYFLILFSIAGLATIIDATAFSPRWWLAALLVVLSYFSMAAGVVTAAVVFAICGVQFMLGCRSGRRELLALALLAAATAAMVRYTPVSPGQAAYHAHSVRQFIGALIAVASWPNPPGQQPAIINLLRAAFINSPALLVGLHTLRLRPPLANRIWLLPALAGWAVMFVVATAYARALGPLAPRYLDLIVFLPLLNAACLLYLIDVFKHSWLRRPSVRALLVFWLVLILVGVTTQTSRFSLRALAQELVAARAETENLRAYLASGDIRVLENKPEFSIPYPDPHRLAAIASTPIIRAILPPELVGQASASRAQQHGLARFTGRPIQAIKGYVLRWGVLLMPIGLALFLLGLMMVHGRRREPEAVRQ